MSNRPWLWPALFETLRSYSNKHPIWTFAASYVNQLLRQGQLGKDHMEIQALFLHLTRTIKAVVLTIQSLGEATAVGDELEVHDLTRFGEIMDLYWAA